MHPWMLVEITRVTEFEYYFACTRNGVPLNSVMSPAVRSVTLNLANKFSQCTFSVEHYDLFSDLIILPQA